MRERERAREGWIEKEKQASELRKREGASERKESAEEGKGKRK